MGVWLILFGKYSVCVSFFFIVRGGDGMFDILVIEECENGFFVVKGFLFMKNMDGSEVEIKLIMVFCCCGVFKSKLFCDGFYKEVGFESWGGMFVGCDWIIMYEGFEVLVIYNLFLCLYVVECGRFVSYIFNFVQKFWV